MTDTEKLADMRDWRSRVFTTGSPNSMTYEQVVATLNAHKHRGRDDWWFDNSTGEISTQWNQPMPIHPLDAKIIAAYYWHKFNVEAETAQ